MYREYIAYLCHNNGIIKKLLLFSCMQKKERKFREKQEYIFIRLLAVIIASKCSSKLI